MAVRKFNIRYLSIFIDRFVPRFFKEKYPEYRLYIYHFLRYLEQNNKTWDLISDFIKFMDIDKIDSETDTALREQMLDQILNRPGTAAEDVSISDMERIQLKNMLEGGVQSQSFSLARILRMLWLKVRRWWKTQRQFRNFKSITGKIVKRRKI